MRQQIKFFLSFLTLGLFFIVSSCSEDYEITEHNHTHDGYTIKNYSYKQASKLSKFQKASKIVKQKLNLKFSDLKTFKNSKFKKSVARDTDLSFAIDSSLIKEVTKDDVTTYTMLVALDTVDYSDNSFDNLIVKVDSQNNTSLYIIHYTPTGEAVYNAIHNSYTFQGDTELSKVYGITTLGGSGSGSGNENGGGSVDYGGSEAGGGANTWDSVICVTLIKCNYLYTHIAGPGCANTYSETICYTNPNYNPWSGVGSSPEEEDPLEGDNSNPGGGGGSTSSSSPTNDTGGTSTVTVLPEEIVALDTDLIKTPAQIEREKDFKAGLTLQQKIWLSNHDDVEDDIFEYLESQVTDLLEEEYLDEEKLFVMEAIISLMGNGEIDFENKVILDSSIVNNQKIKCVYENLKSMSSTIFNDVINNHFDSSKKAHIRYKIASTPNGEYAYTKGSTNNGSTFFEITLDPNIVSNGSNIEISLLLIHESIHAELLDRCVYLGIINAFSGGNPIFTNSADTYTTQDSLFALLVYKYLNFNGMNSQWNHDLFTVLGYRTKMAQNLIDIHPWLNDVNNDFLTNINNDPYRIGGDYSLQEIMNYISWIGLEGTQDYLTSINNNISELARMIYVENSARTKYTDQCN